MKYWIAAALTLALAFGGSAPAQSQPAGKPAAVSPHAAELVRRMYRAAHIDRTIDTMMATLMPAMVDAIARQNSSITADQRRILSETVQEVMHDATPKLLERMVPAYAEVYSESELEAIVAFYESAAGKALIEKMPLMGPKSAELMREMLPDLQRDMASRLCAKLDCTTNPALKPKVS